MALTVEDGSGLSNADALISLADANSYHDTRGNDTWTGTDEVKEEAIRRASFFMASAFPWKGLRVNGRDQTMPWPRSAVQDDEGYSVPSTAVPQEVVDACAEYALRELVTAGTLTPDVTPSDTVKREKIGPIETEYANFRSDPAASRPVVTAAEALISGLLEAGGSNHLVGSTFRA